jgi:hypothetical protein
MRFYNIIENDRKVYHHDYGKGFHAGFDPERQRNYGRYPAAKGHYGLYILNKIWSNRKLRLLLLLLSVILVAIIILVIIFGLKLLGSLSEVIRTEGLKGITDAITGFIEKLWTGSK